MSKKSQKLSMYIRYDIGQGRPLVLIHGLFGDGTLWDSIKGLVAQDYRVIVVDILGHGRSPQSRKQTYSPEENTEALRNSLTKLGIKSDVTVVGYSMGGAVALAYAATYPDEIEQLILIATPFYLRPEQMERHRYASSVLLTKISTGFYHFSEKTLNRKFGQKLANFANKSDFFHGMIGAHDTVLDPVVISRVIDKMVRTFDFAGYLSKVSAPTTFYAGKKDLFIIQGQLGSLRRYQSYIDIQRLEIIKTDHMLVQNFPKKMAGLITAHKQQLLHIAVDEGAGSPMIFLHGIESSAAYWQKVYRQFARNRRVIVIDLLGFGNSPKPRNIGYTLDEQAYWLERTLKSLKLSKVEIVGHSLGSLVALRHSVLFPARVKKVIAFSPVFVEPDSRPDRILTRSLYSLNASLDPNSMYARILKSVGYKRMVNFTPLLRSVQNGILGQKFNQLLASARNVQRVIVYGTKDWFIDEKFISRRLNKSEVIKIKGGTHNIPLAAPELTCSIISGSSELENNLRSKRFYPSSKTVFGQVVSLALPTLFIKAVFLIIVGLLLFTWLAPYVVVFGLIFFLAYKGIEIIRNAFSAKYEGLSYLSYLLLGGAVIVSAWFVRNHPQDSLRVALLAGSAVVALTGLLRILVGLIWTKAKKRRTYQLLSGLLYTLVGLSALGGSLVSVHIVVYSIAVLLIYAGMRSFFYFWSLVGLSVVRGFTK